MKDLIKIFIIVALVGVGAKWYANYKTAPNFEESPLQYEEAPIEDILDLPSSQEIPLPDLGPESKTEPVAKREKTSGQNSLLVEDQKAGSEVIVSELNLEKASWVAVHDDKEGKPGNVLGAHWFPAGKSVKVTVELLRPTLSAKIYYALLHEDALDDKLYASSKDLPLEDASGEVISVKFQAN